MSKEDNKIVEEVKNQILDDIIFKKALLFDLLKWTIKAVGWGGAIMGILIAFFGYKSLGNLAENTMRDFLISKGSEFERQFDRLSNIPSYVTIGKDLTFNDTTNNFIPLPIFQDIKRRANYEECEWFFSPSKIEGKSIEFLVTPDTLDDIPGLRVTSINQILIPVQAARHGGGIPTKAESPLFNARFFIFASRKIQ